VAQKIAPLQLTRWGAIILLFTFYFLLARGLTPGGRSGDRPYRDCAYPSTRWASRVAQKIAPLQLTRWGAIILLFTLYFLLFTTYFLLARGLDGSI
jgi:hypothetical protein